MTLPEGLPWHVLPAAGPEDAERLAKFARHTAEIEEAYAGDSVRVDNHKPLWGGLVAPGELVLQPRTQSTLDGCLAPTWRFSFERRRKNAAGFATCMMFNTPVSDPDRSHLLGLAHAFDVSARIARLQIDRDAIETATQAAARTMAVIRHLLLAAKDALGGDVQPGDTLRVAHGLAGAPAYLRLQRIHKQSSSRIIPMAADEDVRRVFVEAGCEAIVSTSMSDVASNKGGYPVLTTKFVHGGIKLDQWNPSPIDLARSLRRVAAPDIRVGMRT